MIIGELLIECPKLNFELVDVKKTCFDCKAGLLQGVQIKSKNDHRDYEITVTCNNQDQKPKAFFVCPNSKTRTPFEVCLNKCSEFGGIVFYGQLPRIICHKEPK